MLNAEPPAMPSDVELQAALDRAVATLDYARIEADATRAVAYLGDLKRRGIADDTAVAMTQRFICPTFRPLR